MFVIFTILTKRPLAANRTHLITKFLSRRQSKYIVQNDENAYMWSIWVSAVRCSPIVNGIAFHLDKPMSEYFEASEAAFPPKTVMELLLLGVGACLHCCVRKHRHTLQTQWSIVSTRCRNAHGRLDNPGLSHNNTRAMTLRLWQKYR